MPVVGGGGGCFSYSKCFQRVIELKLMKHSYFLDEAGQEMEESLGAKRPRTMFSEHPPLNVI